MNQLNSKLRSQKGASLSIALLLFLVCMVVGVVVMTAGTTSSGTLSKLAEMDQRYYSVASAAEILGQELSSMTVMIERTKTTTTVVTTDYTVSYDPDTGETTITPQSPVTGSPTVQYETVISSVVLDTDPPNVVFDTDTPDTAITITDLSFLTARAVKVLFGTNNCNTETAWNCSLNNGFSENGTFKLEHTANISTDLSYLTINGSYELKSDGSLVIDLEDAVPETNGHYKMRLTMGLDTEKTKDYSTTTTPSDSTEVYDITDGYQEKITTTDTAVKRTIIGWNVLGVESVVSSPTPVPTPIGGGSGED